MSFTATVLQIVPALNGGGAERTTLEMARAIVAAGGRALVATEGGRLEGDIEKAGGEIFHLPAASKNPVVMRANAGRLARLARAQGVDILHARSRAPAWSALWAAAALRRMGAPVKTVGTYHGAYRAQSALKRFYNSSLVRGDLVIANSLFTEAAVLAQFAPPREKLRTIPRGADLDYFNPDRVDAARVRALAGRWGFAGSDNGAPSGGLRSAVAGRAIKILAPGRLTPWKGQEDLVRALALIASGARAGGPLNGAGAAVKFAVAFCGGAQGTESFTRLLRDAITTNGLDTVAKLVGDCEDMPAAYAWSDIVVAPSRRPEAFGRVAAEAGAMGRLAIACDHGGARETIIDGETGLLTSPSDPEALADAILDSVKMGHQARAAMGAAAKKRVGDNYSVAAMCDATLFAYKELLGTG